MFEQVLRDLNSGSQVQRGLAASAAGAGHAGIGSHQFAQLLEHPEACGRVRIQHGATLHQKCRQFGHALIQNADAPGPPSASSMDIGAGTEQHIDRLAVASLHGRQNGLHTRGAIIGHGFVDVRL